MCNSGRCRYESFMGDCKLPKGHLCPADHEPEECQEAKDMAEHHKDQAAEARAESRKEARNG